MNDYRNIVLMDSFQIIDIVRRSLRFNTPSVSFGGETPPDLTVIGQKPPHIVINMTGVAILIQSLFVGGSTF